MFPYSLQRTEPDYISRYKLAGKVGDFLFDKWFYVPEGRDSFCSSSCLNHTWEPNTNAVKKTKFFLVVSKEGILEVGAEKDTSKCMLMSLERV